MNDEHVPQEPEAVPPPPPPPPPYAPPYAAPPQPRRTLTIPVVAAIAGAAFVIGGLLGGIIGYAVHDDGPDYRMRPGGPMQRWDGPNGPGRDFKQELPQPPAAPASPTPSKTG